MRPLPRKIAPLVAAGLLALSLGATGPVDLALLAALDHRDRPRRAVLGPDQLSQGAIELRARLADSGGGRVSRPG